MNKNTGDGELEEILFMAFVGLWMRDADGNFVSLDDKYGVLKDRLKVEIKKYAAQEANNARLDEATAIRKQFHGHRFGISEFMNNRIEELQNLTKEKESSE